jgi:SAM-dependent methyltransferase
MDRYGAASYGDGMADVYDDWYADRGDTDGAVAAIAALVGDGGRVLELGIGTGRLALPLAARGIDVWGLDASSAMVERLRAKPGGDAIPVAIGDMADIDLSSLPDGPATRFSIVLAADNTFFNLTTEEAQRRCLHRVRSVLAPRGQFVLEAFVPATDAPASSVEARTVELDQVILTATHHDADAQTVAGQHIELRESGIRLHPWMIRYLTPSQLDQLAFDAGLRLNNRWPDWRGGRFDEADERHVSLYGAG